MRVAILAWSDLDQSESIQTYEWFKRQGAEITAYYWGQPQIPGDVKKMPVEVGQEIPGIDEYDLIVRGPAVHPRQIKTTKPVTTLTNIFFENCPTKNVIGITGTKGKGTTSTLVTKMLQANGHRVWLGGNIGHPLLNEIQFIQQDDWVVLEISAAQAIDIKYSPHIAACLMVVPEHLDWHTDLDEYLMAKRQLFAHQAASDLTIYNALNENSIDITKFSTGRRVGYAVPDPGAETQLKDGAYVDGATIYYRQTPVSNTDSVRLRGRHNLENICAAICCVWDITNGNVPAIKEVIHSFHGLEHRIELVRELNGVQYYNDSFSTAPETAIAAIKSFDAPKVLILGGADKQIPFVELANVIIQSDVRQVILIDNSAYAAEHGDTGPAIEKLLRNREFTNITTGLKTMDEIVKAAQQAAQPGDVVLLSTGCASFGMFKNYKERGDQFKQAVNSL